MSTFPAKEKALGMYRKMYEIRKYEESIYYLFLEGIMPGTIHQSTGEEASAVGMLYDLRKSDWMASTHRPAGHDIAKGISVKAMMCEMFGAAEGCCHGIGGAMHTGDISVGAMTANAIVGGNLPIAAGAVISASHNPYEHNGIKLFSGSGFKLSDELEDRIESLILSDEPLPMKTHGEIGRILDIKLPTVKTHVSHILSKLGVKRRRLMEIASARRLVISSRMTKLTSCEIAVAMAAPAVPSPRPKISSGSSRMLSRPPVVMPTIAYAASPSKRSRLFITNEHIMNGAA